MGASILLQKYRFLSCLLSISITVNASNTIGVTPLTLRHPFKISYLSYQSTFLYCLYKLKWFIKEIVFMADTIYHTYIMAASQYSIKLLSVNTAINKVLNAAATHTFFVLRYI